MAPYGLDQYKRTQVATVDSGRLIVLLYDGAIAFLHKAGDCLARHEAAGLALNINRAMDILDELDASLNLSEGGEIAENLRRLYRFMIHHLIKARSDEEPARIQDVIRMLGNLNDAWKKALGNAEAQEVLGKKKSPTRPSTKSMVA